MYNFYEILSSGNSEVLMHLIVCTILHIVCVKL